METQGQGGPQTGPASSGGVFESQGRKKGREAWESGEVGFLPLPEVGVMVGGRRPKTKRRNRDDRAGEEAEGEDAENGVCMGWAEGGGVASCVWAVECGCRYSTHISKESQRPALRSTGEQEETLTRTR